MEVPALMTTRLLERRSERPRIMMTRYARLQLAVKLCFCTSSLQVEAWFIRFAHVLCGKGRGGRGGVRVHTMSRCHEEGQINFSGRATIMQLVFCNKNSDSTGIL